MKKISFKRLVLRLIVFLCPLIFSQAVYAVTDYDAKAAMIFQFYQYVEWPADKDFKKQPNINICILGSSPIKQSISTLTVAASKKFGKQFSLVEVKNSKKISPTCLILFISDSESDKLSTILEDIKDEPVLSISDIPDFATQGGMIGELIDDNNRPKFIINRTAIEATGMRPAADMLGSALKVM